jgi:hypothetical protein
MKYIMRQSRDGAIELVDRSPVTTKDQDLMSAISRVGWEQALIWYMRTLAWVWMAKGLFHWAIILGAFPSLGQFTTMALPLRLASGSLRPGAGRSGSYARWSRLLRRSSVRARPRSDMAALC